MTGSAVVSPFAWVALYARCLARDYVLRRKFTGAVTIIHIIGRFEAVKVDLYSNRDTTIYLCMHYTFTMGSINRSNITTYKDSVTIVSESAPQAEDRYNLVPKVYNYLFGPTLTGII